jgi:hypothetical protein
MASGSNTRTARHRGHCFPSRPLTPRAAIQASRLPGGPREAQRRADYSKAMPCGTHPLATEPGAPVRFTLLVISWLSTVPGIRTLISTV